MSTTFWLTLLSSAIRIRSGGCPGSWLRGAAAAEVVADDGLGWAAAAAAMIRSLMKAWERGDVQVCLALTPEGMLPPSDAHRVSPVNYG